MFCGLILWKIMTLITENNASFSMTLGVVLAFSATKPPATFWTEIN